MGRINIRLSDKEEIELKRLASENGVTLSDYCRSKLFSQSNKEDPATDNVPVEAAINEMNNDMQDMLKKLIELNRNLLRENRYYGELLGNYFTALFTSEETNLQESFSLAQQAAEESVKDL